MDTAKLRQVLQLWAFALAVSAALVAAGQRWPEPLPIGSASVWGLLLVLPVLVVLLLLARWPLPASSELSLNGQEGELEDSIQERD